MLPRERACDMVDKGSLQMRTHEQRPRLNKELAIVHLAYKHKYFGLSQDIQRDVVHTAIAVSESSTDKENRDQEVGGGRLR